MSTTIYTEKNWVVYLTIYSGKLLPRRYIGYTYQEKFDTGYNGTPTSDKYGAIYRSEQKNNKHLFESRVLRRFYTKNVAKGFEAKIQRRYDVVKSEDYFNMNIAGKEFCGVGKHTDETKAKIGAAHKGKKCSAETKAKMSAAHKGKKKSAEHRANISAAQKGMKCSAETKAKISASMKGKKLSAEHLAKRSASRRDKTIYTFSHKGGDIFEGTRYELRQAFPEYKWNSGGLRRMITGRLKSHCGWSINICINLI